MTYKTLKNSVKPTSKLFCRYKVREFRRQPTPRDRDRRHPGLLYGEAFKMEMYMIRISLKMCGGTASRCLPACASHGNNIFSHVSVSIHFLQAHLQRTLRHFVCQ